MLFRSELIAQVQIPPQIGKYKVFIIDEVHMLSAAAFNAFLKTLEEPPHHAIFILATTEKHKLLPTILSRCQIYDFNRIGPKDTIEHLQYVAAQEGVNAEPQALGVIARKADGGMRDALSIFDQVVSFTNGNVTYQAVIDNLNVLDYEYFFRVTDAFLENNVSQALLILNEIIARGFDPQHFITGLSSHLREVMVSSDPITLPLIEAGEEVAARYAQQAAKCSAPFLYRAIEISNECDLNYRASRNKRLLVEIALIRIAQLTAPQTPLPGNVSSGEPLRSISPQQGAPQPQIQQPTQAPQQPSAPQATVAQTQSQPQAYTQRPMTQSTVQAPPTPTSPPPPPPRGAGKPGLPGLKSISIKGNKKVEEEAGETVRQISEMNEPVSIEALQKAWIEFTRTIPKEAVLVNTMLANKPNLIEPTRFEVVVENREQIDRINLKGADLLYYLRMTLRNSHLTMSIRESEMHEQQRAFSQREKYRSAERREGKECTALSKLPCPPLPYQ